MTNPILHHVPPSFYSQITRLAFAEKSIEFEGCYVIPGPSSYESYKPSYMRLNPNGTVPTLVHEGKVFSESLDILRYLETRFPGTELWKDREDSGDIDRWVEQLYTISFRELSYGSPRLQKLGGWINAKRVRNLRDRLAENPDLADVYAAKIEDIETFTRNTFDPDHMKRQVRALEQKLDRLDNALIDGSCLASDRYSMADLVWTVGVARLLMMGMSPFEDRPALAYWYGRMKTRPSFSSAGVMERFKPSVLMRVMWTKLKGRMFA